MFAPPIAKAKTAANGQHPHHRPRYVHALPRTIGNQAALRQIAGNGALQRKLAIGAVDDPLEREADGVAEQVMGMPDPARPIGVTPPQVSRTCAACEQEDDATLQTKPDESIQSGNMSAAPSRLQRKLSVAGPDAMIPNPGGKGAAQTDAVTIDSYLKTLCPAGSPAVAPGTGAVTISPAFCTAPALAPGISGPPDLSPAQKSATATGCGCICDLAASTHAWTIKVDDADWPHTDFDDEAKADGKTPGGTGGAVTAPSPNSPKQWGTASAAGAPMTIDPWLVLGHELCGHAWLGDHGGAGPDDATNRGEGGHQETVARENALRAEHGIDLRGTFKDPNCGESFWRDKAAPTPVHWSDFRDVCVKWRDDYNKTHKTSYTINDKVP